MHDEEYEAVIHPLGELIDASRAIVVDYDDRDLTTVAPTAATYVLGDAPIKTKTFWTKLERDLVDHLVRSRRLTVAANRELEARSPGRAKRTTRSPRAAWSPPTIEPTPRSPS